MKKLWMYFLILLLFAGMLPIESAAAIQMTSIDSQSKEGIITVLDEDVPLFQKADTASEVLTSLQDEAIVQIIGAEDNDFVYINYVDKFSETEYTGYVQTQYLQVIESEDQQVKEALPEKEMDLMEAETQSILTGLALKQPVQVYKADSKEAAVLKQYDYGTLLKYETHNDDWYKATIYKNGSPQTGYIPKEDAGNAEEATTVTGIALQTSTKIYDDTDKKKVLKSYEKGSILKYKAYKKDWYTAVVIIKGKKHTGFIHVKDVETSYTKIEAMKGIAKNKTTQFYKHASKSSKKMKSYPQGQILKVQKFTDDWYKGIVYVKGKPASGYLPVNDLETVKQSGDTIKGVAAAKPVHVYDRASKNSKTIKTYTYGSVLSFRDFSNNWYEATVYKKGVPITGYLYKADVGSLDTVLFGYAQKAQTPIYEENSTASAQIKTYPLGAILKYKIHDDSWYQVTVFIDGIKTIGYLNKKDVGNIGPAQYGYAYKDRTHIYEGTDRNTKKLKSYEIGTTLKYRTYNDQWYQVTVKIKGKAVTGYLNKRCR